MAKVIIYSSNNCPYCMAAKRLLTELGASYEEILIEGNDAILDEMVRLSGKRSVPQIFINDKPIGGFDDLSVLHKSGKLHTLLGEE